MKNEEEEFKKQMEQALLEGTLPEEDLRSMESHLSSMNMLEGEFGEGQLQQKDKDKFKYEIETFKINREKYQMINHTFMELFRGFKEDKVNRFQLEKPDMTALHLVLQIWKGRSKFNDRFLLTLELVDCDIPNEDILKVFKFFPSIIVIVNGTKLENTEGVIKTEGDYFYEGVSNRMEIYSEVNHIYYSGQVLNFRYHGKGELSCSEKKNSFIYRGSFENGKRHGIGELRTRKSVFIGHFVDDFKEGLGSQVVVKRAKNDQKDSQPRVKSSFEGNFKAGYREGEGKEVTPHGTYSGNWKQDLKDGYGEMTYTNGDSYKGQWARGEFHGQGTYHENENCVYTGEFKNGKYHGDGIMEYENGDRFDGKFEFGKKQGKGKYDWENGDYYDGDWKNDSADGEGTCMFGDDFFVGEFKNGRKHGEGELTNEEGDVIRGIWENGKQIKIIEKNGEPYEEEEGNA